MSESSNAIKQWQANLFIADSKQRRSVVGQVSSGSERFYQLRLASKNFFEETKIAGGGLPVINIAMI